MWLMFPTVSVDGKPLDVALVDAIEARIIALGYSVSNVTRKYCRRWCFSIQVGKKAIAHTQNPHRVTAQDHRFGDLNTLFYTNEYAFSEPEFVELNELYKAEVIKGNDVRVGCQTINIERLKELLAVHERVNS